MNKCRERKSAKICRFKHDWNRKARIPDCLLNLHGYTNYGLHPITML